MWIRRGSCQFLVAGATLGARGVEREVKNGFRFSASGFRLSRMPLAGESCFGFERNPSSHDLLCKRRAGWALRGWARASTIKLFSFRPRSRAGLPRQPIRGGA
jgi:hypothetical protein